MPFAVAAVVLAAVGLYGLIAFSVAQRSHEMGISSGAGCIAARAPAARACAEGVGLAAVGTAIGIAGGLAATRALVGLMAGIQPNDPLTFAVVAVMLLTCASSGQLRPGAASRRRGSAGRSCAQNNEDPCARGFGCFA